MTKKSQKKKAKAKARGRPRLDDGLTADQRYNEKRNPLLPRVDVTNDELKVYEPIVRRLELKYGTKKAVILAALKLLDESIN